ncbi:MAG TPA: hypothetical protein PKD18_10500 [Saprospiraceae bacterium]|nr:hypothetical protein [Saprospiraceae bacterium]
MKFIHLIIIGAFILICTECTGVEEFQNELNGEYAGTLVGEWEKLLIKDFNTNPDTTFTSNTYSDEFEITIKDSIYILSAYNRLTTGSLHIKEDSLTFGISTPECDFNADCQYILSGMSVKYELNANLLELYSSYDWDERQNSPTEKQFIKGKTAYELVKIKP